MSMTGLMMPTKKKTSGGKAPVVVYPPSGRKSALSRTEQQEQAETLSVALAQPHRAGDANKRLEDPIWRFCQAQRLRNECYAAGVAHMEIVGEARTAQGLTVPGWEPGNRMTGAFVECASPPCTRNCPITECFHQIVARKERALMKLKSVEELLRRIDKGLPGAMTRLTFDQRDPTPYEAGMISDGLLVLAIALRILDLGINAQKALDAPRLS